jgi:hypothetical protein
VIAVSWLVERLLGRRGNNSSPQYQQQPPATQPMVITVPVRDLIDTFQIPRDMTPFLWALRQGDCALSFLNEEQVTLLMMYMRVVESARMSFQPTSYHPDVLEAVWGGLRDLSNTVQAHMLTLCRAMRSYYGFTMKVTRGMFQ